jgi:GPH family glycoside/pentoside/hexuronide:cation symporter
MSSEEKVPLKERILFGLSAIPDQTTYQGFSLLVFTFYFSVIDLGNLVWIGFIIWTIWNMINDPLLGALSDKTKQKGKLGKRKFFLLISIIPLAITMFLLFYVPFQSANKIPEFIYFLTIIIVFEFVYTLFDVNVNAVFPEQFPSEEKRAQTNIFIKGFTVFGIILAAVPTLTKQTPQTAPGDPGYAAELQSLQFMYIIWGIYLAVVVVAFAIPFLLKGIKEKEELEEHFERRPKFFESLKATLTNKTFVKFVIANTMIWYVFNTLITIFPLFFEHVIKHTGFLKTVSLMSALIVAALVLPFHRWLGKKIGMRNAIMATLGVWIVLLIPYFFLGPGMDILGVIVTASQGFALSGALFYVDILHGDVIDEDAVKYGVKRSASYYGINAFIHRISTILTILTIMIVFTGTSWAGGYTPIYDETVEIGLKVIIFVFPAIGCLVAIVFFKWYDLHGEKLEKMREELKKHPELVKSI